jgi:hypothetical protein
MEKMDGKLVSIRYVANNTDMHGRELSDEKAILGAALVFEQENGKYHNLVSKRIILGNFVPYNAITFERYGKRAEMLKNACLSPIANNAIKGESVTKEDLANIGVIEFQNIDYYNNPLALPILAQPHDDFVNNSAELLASVATYQKFNNYEESEKTELVKSSR